MTAALEVGAQWWDDSAHPLNDDGTEGRHEMASACAEIWLAALKIYYLDARSAVRGVKSADSESLEDLTGSRRLLANLCRPIDADVEVVAAGMIEALDAGRRFDTGAMNRVVPEIHENYRLGEWRERTKRRGKPEALTLG